ncbi:MAG: rhodanese-like domain-containing protein, partial [Hydrogenovibrio sp.]|nr:rhodanese-like domain-containing protein [Hydrogenovibrio sp.]
KITKPNRMQQILRKLGLDIQTPVIVYDNGLLVDAARLFWALEVYGLKHVKVMNTGYDYWVAQGYPTSKIQPSVNASQYIAEVDHNRLATKFSTLIATKSPNQVIIDARPKAAYEGEVSSAKRYGHIPKAINIPASHNLKQDHEIAHLQPVSELKNLYGNIAKTKKVIIYCAIGRISAANYLALRELGYEVSNYDASWKEWGNDFSLPIVNPSKR